MKTKRIFLFTVCVMAYTSGVLAQSHYKGEKGVSSAGGIVGYAVENEALTVGIDYRYNIGDQLRLSPSFLYTLKNGKDISAMYFNADAHYLTRLTEQLTLYPIAGIGVSNRSYSWTETAKNPSTGKDDETTVTRNDLRFGLNLGVGCEGRISRDIIVGVEFKYNLTTEKGYHQAMILTRVAYYY